MTGKLGIRSPNKFGHNSGAVWCSTKQQMGVVPLANSFVRRYPACNCVSSRHFFQRFRDGWGYKSAGK